LDWGLVKEGFQEPEHFLRDWDASIDIDFTFVSRNAVSSVEGHYEYTGGAHGNSYRLGRSFIEENGSVREFKLEEMFDPASDWEKRLVEHCLGDLRTQGATWVIEDPFDSKLLERFSKDDLRSFTLSASGMRFYFSPYHVGSYADGVFTVFVPYSVIFDCLPQDSPARRFMSPEIEAGP
jgi:hypothetical protein